MDTRKLMRDSLKGCDRAEVARFLKMSLGSLNNQVAGELPYRPKGTSNNLLDKAWDFVDFCHGQTGNIVVLEKFAEELGYFVVPNPEINTTDMKVLDGIAGMIRDFAAIIEEVANANRDGGITQKESDRIRSKWEILKRISEEFVITCEVGKYSGGNECKF